MRVGDDQVDVSLWVCFGWRSHDWEETYGERLKRATTIR
jgi:hypothetical protein